MPTTPFLLLNLKNTVCNDHERMDENGLSRWERKCVCACAIHIYMFMHEPKKTTTTIATAASSALSKRNEIHRERERERESIAYLFCREILFTRLSPAFSIFNGMGGERYAAAAAAKIQAMQSENIHKQIRINECEQASERARHCNKIMSTVDIVGTCPNMMQLTKTM